MPWTFHFVSSAWKCSVRVVPFAVSLPSISAVFSPVWLIFVERKTICGKSLVSKIARDRRNLSMRGSPVATVSGKKSEFDRGFADVALVEVEGAGELGKSPRDTAAADLPDEEADAG